MIRLKANLDRLSKMRRRLTIMYGRCWGLKAFSPPDLGEQEEVVTQVKYWYWQITKDGIEICLQRVTQEAR